MAMPQQKMSFSSEEARFNKVVAMMSLLKCIFMH